VSGLVAIHQPNFFPWLGYFDKIRRADIFIFLDDVDYPRAGSGGMGSWVNRVRVDIQGEARWINAPVQRMPLGFKIRAATIDDSQNWRRRLLRTLEASYRKAPGYAASIGMIELLIANNETNLATFNMGAIITIAEHLGLSTRFVRQSDVAHEGRATDRLVSLVRAVGGDAYLMGGGAAGYQDDAAFAAHGLGLVRQEFRPHPYGVEAGFIPGLSVLDLLLRCEHPRKAIDAAQFEGGR
jgi:hypothetical protein